MGRAAHAHRERRARWALLRGDRAPREDAPPETPTDAPTETAPPGTGRPARGVQERVTCH